MLAVNSSGRLTEVFDANSSLAATLRLLGHAAAPLGGRPNARAVPGDRPRRPDQHITPTIRLTPRPASTTTCSPTPRRGRQRPRSTCTTPSGQITQQTDPSGSVTAVRPTRAPTPAAGRDRPPSPPTRWGRGPANRRSDRLPVFEQRAGRADHRRRARRHVDGAVLPDDPVSLLPLRSVDGDGNVTDFDLPDLQRDGRHPGLVGQPAHLYRRGRQHHPTRLQRLQSGLVQRRRRRLRQRQPLPGHRARVAAGPGCRRTRIWG